MWTRPMTVSQQYSQNTENKFGFCCQPLCLVSALEEGDSSEEKIKVHQDLAVKAFLSNPHPSIYFGIPPVFLLPIHSLPNAFILPLFSSLTLLPVSPASVFWDLLIQRPTGTSYLQSFGFNRTPWARRHIPSSKKTKGKVAVGRVSTIPFNSHKSFNHDTERNCFFPRLTPLMCLYFLFFVFALLYLTSSLLSQ